ncbi:MAG: S-layer protein [Candidatus Peregrinibacteria bacterium GW2011_GWE2_39_6]|nr:MAG: S-layer protein [Candidatus Peregrinibacteria bacterium GW2011_GWF2_39_17]KKR25883.1 MAG: S-layer protein [Candidatus Peregrinibacteria bacterium GW2011_GWE2_39_6]HCW32426.1 hypothetical protein [Candidatus Peregrinibacteria bacterium]
MSLKLPLFCVKTLLFFSFLFIGSLIDSQATVYAGVYDSNYTLETEHFVIAYEYTETQDQAQKTADELENIIWEKEINDLGFKSPLRHQGDKFRVYIDDNNEAIKNPKVLGVTVASSDGEIYIAVSESITDWNTYIDTLAHEFFHVIQYRYLSPDGASFQGAPSSSFESGAVWIESKVYPEIDDYASYMNVFLTQPNGSIFLGARPGLSYWEYSLSIWVEWVQENLGTHVVNNFWQELYTLSTQEYDITNSFYPYLVYNRIISWENHTLLELFHKFTIANLNTDQNYAIGKNLNDVVPITTYNAYPVLNTGTNYVSLFGSRYFNFYPESSTGNLKFTLTGDPLVGYLISLVPLDSTGKILHEKVVTKLVTVGSSTGTIILENAQQYSKIIGIVSPVDYQFSDLDLSTEIFQIDKTFSFEADWVTEAPEKIILDKVTIPTISPYPDLSTTHKNYKAITYLTAKKVLQGYPDGTFGPDKSINRAEFFKIVVASLNINIDAQIYNNCYPDVHEEWFAPYICYGTEQGWIQGYPDGTFKPEQPVNKVEAIKMLLESRGISISDLNLLAYNIPPYTDTLTDEWYYPYLEIAYGLKLLEETGEMFNPDAYRNRAEVSEETFRLTTLLDAQKVTPYPIFYCSLVDEQVID